MKLYRIIVLKLCDKYNERLNLFLYFKQGC